MTSDKAKKISGERIMLGKLIAVDVDQVIEPGATSPARREVVRHPGAAAVVPCTIGGGVILVRQYRYAPDSFLWEIPAGILEKGEDPLQAAQRELAEETGYRAGEIAPLATLHSSPGFSDEVIQLFRAERLIPGTATPDPEERLETKEFNILDALDMISEGVITDSKTVCGLLLVAREICPVVGRHF
jgi:ADP-ribose pyrophosphatase